MIEKTGRGLKISIALTGKKLSPEHRKNISIAHMGIKYPNRKGYIASEEHRRRNGEAKKGKIYAWKGDEAGYAAFHARLRKKYGGASKCQNLDCDKLNISRFEWASITENFKDENDYLQLCVRCHKRWDMDLIKVRLEGNKILNSNYSLTKIHDK